jgi:hypothetical protein
MSNGSVQRTQPGKGTDTEPIAPPPNPEPHHLPRRLAHRRVLPVQVRLLRDVQVQVVLPRRLVVLPCRPCPSPSSLALVSIMQRNASPTAQANATGCTVGRRRGVRTLERRAPIVRRAAVARRVVPGRAPDVPVALRVGFARPGLLEPLVLCTAHARAQRSGGYSVSPNPTHPPQGKIYYTPRPTYG